MHIYAKYHRIRLRADAARTRETRRRHGNCSGNTASLPFPHPPSLNRGEIQHEPLRPKRPRPLLAGTVVSVVVVACLYWAGIFIPLALAVYLTFLLGPR